MVEKKEELVELILQLVATLSPQEKQKIISGLLEKKEGFPISIFRSPLSGLEAITVYLKEQQGKSITEIASLLHRQKSTIYTTYQKAKKKWPGKIDLSDSSITIPYEIFADRKFAVLESLVAYLKEEMNLPLVKISTLLNKKYSTIRTVYVRYKIKNGKK
ncbi:MAG TPA: hypothetical protein VJB13_00675 [Candidatus Nanoarchaeia archaeon]|nr:hypothetical protein [Candidatus Nanoarchaeia archaeon]